MIKGPTRGLDDTAITAEVKYSTNITRSRKKLCLSLYYNGSDSFLYANGEKLYQYKAKDSERKPCRLCLGNISKDLIVHEMKTKLNGYVCDFSVDYNTIDDSDIADIHKCFMKKHDTK